MLSGCQHIIIEGVLIRIIIDGLKDGRNVRGEKGINNLRVKILTRCNARALLLVNKKEKDKTDFKTIYNRVREVR
jgi:hypothetical protein